MKEQEFKAIPEKDRLNRSLTGLAYYASVHKPNLSAQKMFEADPAYMVKLALETPEAVAEAQSFGLKIHDADEFIPMPWVKINTKIKAKNGKTAEERFEETKPNVVDAMQNEIPATVLIGNGSRVTVKFMTFWHPASPAHGAGTYMNTVQVLSLVPYEPKGDNALVMDESGFVVGGTEPVKQGTATIRKTAKASAKVSEDLIEDSLDLDDGSAIDPKLFD